METDSVFVFVQSSMQKKNFRDYSGIFQIGMTVKLTRDTLEWIDFVTKLSQTKVLYKQVYKQCKKLQPTESRVQADVINFTSPKRILKLRLMCLPSFHHASSVFSSLFTGGERASSSLWIALPGALLRRLRLLVTTFDELQ